MSGRPQSAAVYRRRRFVLVTVVALLAWAVYSFWPSGDDEPTADPSPGPSASSSTKASATPTPTRTANRATDTTTVTLASGTAACAAEDVRVVPSVTSGQRARQAVSLDLAVSTSAAKPCVFTAKASTMLAVISSGSTAVWDSSVCKASILTDPVMLSPQWSTVVRVAWNARGSGIACSKKEGWASPGKYALEIGTLGGEPSSTTFTLAQPAPKPSPTATKKPTSTPTPSKTPTTKPSTSAKPTD